MFYIRTFLILMFFLALNPFVLSQDEVDTTGKFQTEEIIVTGTRVEQKIIDIPFSVQRISPRSWKITRKQNLNDVLTAIPGLFLQSRYGNHDVRVTVRGFGSRSNTGIRGVRILLDGIPESEPDGQTRIEAIDFSAIGNIELVKGNSSSLYTNSPGGVINFFTDKYFPASFIQNDNEFGAYDLRKNGLKAGLSFGQTKFMVTGSYENYAGYRTHSSEYQTRINSILETPIGTKSYLSIFGYYVNGLIKIPGSVTLEQFIASDTAANARSISRDEKRMSNKGRLGLKFFSEVKSSKIMDHVFEVMAYGTIKYFNRVSRTFRIFDRNGLGGTLRYINKTKFGNRTNEFSIGSDAFIQSGPISEFGNIGGVKQPELIHLNDETISNAGFYVTENFPLIPNKLNILVTGRYDRVVFASEDLIGPGTTDTSRVFSNFTPKVALNFKITPQIALYGSFGKSYDSPAFNELDNYPFSSDSGMHLINPDLEGQNSTNIEAGIKGSLAGLKNGLFKNTFFEVTFYNSNIKDVIVPFTVDNDVFFRNAATSNRTGLEVGLTTDLFTGLTFKGAYTFQHFKYDEYHAVAVDATGNVTEQDYSNNFEPSNPKQLIEADVLYSRPLSKDITLFVKSNFQHIGEMYVNDANTEELKTESYNLINSQLGFDVNINNFRVMLYGGLNNVLDKKYVAFININSDREEYYESGPRRNFFSGLTLSYLFR